MFDDLDDILNRAKQHALVSFEEWQACIACPGTARREPWRALAECVCKGTGMRRGRIPVLRGLDVVGVAAHDKRGGVLTLVGERLVPALEVCRIRLDGIGGQKGMHAFVWVHTRGGSEAFTHYKTKPSIDEITPLTVDGVVDVVAAKAAAWRCMRCNGGGVATAEMGGACPGCDGIAFGADPIAGAITDVALDRANGTAIVTVRGTAQELRWRVVFDEDCWQELHLPIKGEPGRIRAPAVGDPLDLAGVKQGFRVLEARRG